VSSDPYTVLGLKRSASADEIKKAYRKLAKELHPDVRPDDKAAEERFKRVSAAFNLLSDPEKKRRFDAGEIDSEGNERFAFRPGAGPMGGAGGARGGARGFDPRDFESTGFGGFPGGGAGSGRGPAGSQGDGFEDLFANLFGRGGGPGNPMGGPMGGGRGPSRQKGADIRVKAEVDFIDAIKGSKLRLNGPDGKSFDATIPPGVETGQTLRLRGLGGPGTGGAPKGDVLVEIVVRPHPHWTREGDAILADLPISLTEAVDGGKVDIETPTGRVTLKVPAGSSSGATLRLRGKGVQKPGAAGDMLVRLSIQLPVDLGDLGERLKAWNKNSWTPKRD
jgi:DnaJ-class molecular chaperone